MEELFRVYFTYGILGCGIIIVYTIYRIKDIYSSKNTSIYLNVKYPIWHRYIIGFMVLIVTTLIIIIGVMYLNCIGEWILLENIIPLWEYLIWIEALLLACISMLISEAKNISFGNIGIDCKHGIIPWESIYKYERKSDVEISVYGKVGRKYKQHICIYHVPEQKEVIDDFLTKYGRA